MAKSNFNTQIKTSVVYNQDTYFRYTSDILKDKSCNPINKQQEYELFMQYKQTKCHKIKQQIIKHNLRWVITVAKHYNYPKVSLEDMINEGNLGLIFAIDKFDPTLGYSFITYASRYIKLYITNFINKSSDMVVPINQVFMLKAINKANLILNAQGIFEPSVDQIIDMYQTIKDPSVADLTVSKYYDIINNSKSFVSSSNTLSSEDEQSELSDTFKSEQQYDADFLLKNREKTDSVNKALVEILNDRQYNIIQLYFGLNGNDSLTLDQISNRLNICSARIGQVLNQALKKLREHKTLMVELLSNSEKSF